MTEEEAKEEIIDMANALQLIPNTPKGKAVSMAIKALDQEPVLDKIKAEIKELFKEPAYYIPNYDAYKKVLDIIDKYKAEGNE